MLEERVCVLERENGSLRRKLDALENQSRRNNLIVYGVPEAEHETWEACEDKVVNFVQTDLNIDTDIMIERSHRLGRKRQTTSDAAHAERTAAENVNKPRPIIVKFRSWKDKEKVLHAARGYFKDNRGNGKGVAEDFSEEVREVRRKLVPFLKDQRQKDPTKQVHLRYNKLIIGTKAFVLNDAQDNIVPVMSHGGR
jgi:hypothetical protein